MFPQVTGADQMIYETLPDLSLPKIGFGTARVGGRIIPNRRRDADWMAILCSALEMGYTHFDTAELYALGYSESLVGRAIRDTRVGRENILIATKAWPVHLKYTALMRACENSLRRLNTDYIDVYLIHMPNPLVALKESFRALNELVRQGKVKNIGVSNFNLDLLKEAQALSEMPIVTNQVPYSIYDRRYERNGVIEYCQRNDIVVTAYTPLRHAIARPAATLQAIAKAHQATPQQIALAWLMTQSRVITIPMSFSSLHQKQNLEAVDLKLDADSMRQLSSGNLSSA